jgi:hypothetical protein
MAGGGIFPMFKQQPGTNHVDPMGGIFARKGGI